EIYEKSCALYDRFVENNLVALTPYVVINANMRKATFFGNLQGTARFITLRTEEHAQDEIRTVANDIGQAYVEFESLFPGLKVNRKDMK
ncbi:MAG: FAD-dependent thymidylate synthase, partial [Clostridia bacterium]|nr:FAD-dependent thymidylate synthase [Clostridia bacterium]